MILDDRVRAALARLEQEDADERERGLSASERSRQVTSTTGRFLFALVAPQADCEVLEIGGSRGYSTIWLAAGVRQLGGRVLSLESDPQKIDAWRRNVADAGLEDWAAADAILFSTPEYNGSVPGGLKNAIDWASRPKLEAALTNQTVAVIGASIGQFGAMWAQADLRKILGVAGARVVGDELPVTHAHERFDHGGRLLDEELRGRLALALETVAREAAPLAAPVAA